MIPLQKTFAIYGRFQPFTRAHEQMVNIANAYMTDHSQYKEPIVIGMSETVGDWNNPLSVEQRQKIIRDTVSPDIDLVFETAKDPWKFLQQLTYGFNKPLFLFCGDDQYKDYVRMAGYNKEPEQFNYSKIDVVNCGARNGDMGMSAISATRARSAVAQDDLLMLSQIMSPNLDEKQLLSAFKSIKLSMYAQALK